MQERRVWRSLDLERVFLVPLMTVLLITSAGKLLSDWGDWDGSITVVTSFLLYRVLLVSFYVLVIYLLLARNDATATSHRLTPKVAAYVATFLPFLIPFTGGSPTSAPVSITAVILMAAGVAFSVYSLAVLGSSFGVAPQVRKLVRSGPYRLMRHPLYVGEIVALTGTVLFSPSIGKVAILVSVILLQGYRSIQEERLLEANIPEYTQYKTQTKRFIPGLV